MLNQRDVKILAALMSSPTVTEAARAAGVSKPTVYRRLHDPEFAEAMRAAYAILAEDIAGRLADAATVAINALADIAGGHSCFATESDRIKAADAILGVFTRLAGRDRTGEHGEGV